LLDKRRKLLGESASGLSTLPEPLNLVDALIDP